MKSGIGHRLSILERSLTPLVDTSEPPAPEGSITRYFRSGCLRFSGPGRVTVCYPEYDRTGDIRAAATWLTWQLRTDPHILILLDSDEIGHALDALSGGYLDVRNGRIEHTGLGCRWHTDEKGIRYYDGNYGPREYFSLDHALNIAILAWQNQGESVTLTTAGIMELLQSWRGMYNLL